MSKEEIKKIEDVIKYLELIQPLLSDNALALSLNIIHIKSLKDLLWNIEK